MFWWFVISFILYAAAVWCTHVCRATRSTFVLFVNLFFVVLLLAGAASATQQGIMVGVTGYAH